MSAAWANLIGVLTVMILLSFLGIWVWAWLPHHKNDFDRLARLPMGEDALPAKDAEEDGEPR